MKDFLKYVGATIVGLFVFAIIIGIFGMMSIVGMVASGESTRSIKDNSVLVLKLNGTMSEQITESLQDKLQGTTGLGFQEMLSAIQKAKDNDHVKGIYIEAGMFNAYPAQMEEIRLALADFKKTKKFIIAYGEQYSTGSYYIASVADKVYLNPSGMVAWMGIGGEMRYVKDALAKIGVKVIPIKVGKYKSAVEMFTEDKMSDANREQTERYINGWWDTMVQAVAKSRNISPDSLNAYADRAVTLEDQKNLLKYKMVDGFFYNDQIKGEVKKLLNLDEDEDIRQVSVADMQNVKQKQKGEEVAVYYAFGDIVDEMLPRNILSGGQQIVGKDVCRDLEALAKDKDVKAVVIRINSGGGSAYASEQLWHQITELKKQKPVVVSMSGAAASGGYYMSSNASWIVADPTTITGSIGIFGLFPDFTELETQKLGFKFDEVKTNRNSVFGAEGHTFTPEQLRLLQQEIERGYLLFKKRVADGRHLTMEQVEALAQGHVYLGQDAIKLKLVDELGGLGKAVAKAAQLAKLNEYYTQNYPSQPSILDQLMSAQDQSGTYLDEQLHQILGSYYEPIRLMNQIRHMDRIQARLPFYLSVR